MRIARHEHLSTDRLGKHDEKVVIGIISDGVTSLRWVILHLCQLPDHLHEPTSVLDAQISPNFGRTSTAESSSSSIGETMRRYRQLLAARRSRAHTPSREVTAARNTFVSKTTRRSSPTTHRSRTTLLTNRSHLVYCLRERCIPVKVACQGHTLQEFP